MTVQSGHNCKSLRKAYESMEGFKGGQMDVLDDAHSCGHEL
jgi:hypothetical protein